MSDERIKKIRSWLMKQPRPHAVRVMTLDGEINDVRIPPNPRWVDVAQTIDSLEIATLEAHDENGALLRAERYGEEPELLPDTSGPVPIPPALANDPETARTTHVANLLARAYEHSTNVAFDKLVQLFEIVNARSERMEERLERAEERRDFEFEARLRGEAATQPDAAHGILQALANGVTAGQAANGKGPMNGKGSA
jgi:hypothetical protein